MRRRPAADEFEDGLRGGYKMGAPPLDTEAFDNFSLPFERAPQDARVPIKDVEVRESGQLTSRNRASASFS